MGAIIGWKDKHGDLWEPNGDFLVSYETASFTYEYVEKKWGPLKPVYYNALTPETVTENAEPVTATEEFEKWLKTHPLKNIPARKAYEIFLAGWTGKTINQDK